MWDTDWLSKAVKHCLVSLFKDNISVVSHSQQTIDSCGT